MKNLDPEYLASAAPHLPRSSTRQKSSPVVLLKIARAEIKHASLQFFNPFFKATTYSNQKFKAVFKCSPRLLCDVQTSQNWHFKHETVNDALFIQSLHIGLVWWLEFIWRKGVSQQQNSFIRTAILQL